MRNDEIDALRALVFAAQSRAITGYKRLGWDAVVDEVLKAFDPIKDVLDTMEHINNLKRDTPLNSSEDVLDMHAEEDHERAQRIRDIKAALRNTKEKALANDMTKAHR